MRASGDGGGNATDYDDMPEGMDAFRNELARRIRLFVESRRKEAADAKTAQEKERANGRKFESINPFNSHRCFVARLTPLEGGGR